MTLFPRMPNHMPPSVCMNLKRLAVYRAYSSANANGSTVKPYRALVFSAPGDPLSVLHAQTFPPLHPPPYKHVQVALSMAPINPSDVNVVQGVYPAKPRFRPELASIAGDTGNEKGFFIPGNEGLGEVVELGDGLEAELNGLKVGDRVIMGSAQAGTWATRMNIEAHKLIRVREGVSDVQAATMSINPPTALIMLRNFVDLPQGSFIIQNGANSAVGQAVIQITRAKGLRTINLVRNRPDLKSMKDTLKKLGADYVLTYDELADKSIKETVREWTSGNGIRLALNCVSGKDTTAMVRLLGPDAHLVSYGAMSKSPLSLPTSAFIFKNLTAHGFMLAAWFAKHEKDSGSNGERRKVMKEVMELFSSRLLVEPAHEMVALRGTDETITATVHDVLRKIDAGLYGKKAILRFEPDNHA